MGDGGELEMVEVEVAVVSAAAQNTCSWLRTRPSVESDLLIPCASFIPCPSTCDFFTRSDPARSTRFSFPVVVAPVRLFRPCTCTCTSECERDDAAFIAVADVDRRAAPRCSVPSTSAAEDAFTSVRFLTTTPVSPDAKILSSSFFAPSFARRSFGFSL